MMPAAALQQPQPHLAARHWHHHHVLPAQLQHPASRPRQLAGRARSHGSQLPHLPPEQLRDPLYYPPQRVEADVSHAAFASAFEAAKPSKLRVRGLQAVAAALWQRRTIPSSTGDALSHMFMEHDADNDGVLSAAEIAGMFSSLGVNVSGDQMQALLDDFAGGTPGSVCAATQWPDFVYSLAVSDLNARSHHGDSSVDAV